MATSHFADPSIAMLSTSGGDTVKLFDVSLGLGDPCTLSYSPSPGHHVYSVKWSHTNLVVASAGEDKKISLWRKNGQIIGTIPVSGSESGDNIEVSWLKQHSAPTAGVTFSPSNDKMIASVGLDKKLYTFDRGSRRPSFCIPYEMPFSSLAFRDDGWTLAAGTSHGQVVFYDVRGKPQPFSILCAYGNSEAVTSLCWQRSKPVIVDESNCSPEIALMGGATEDSVIIPDPLLSVTSSSLSLSMALPGSQNPGRLGPSTEASSLTVTSGGSMSSSLCLSMAEETPSRSHLRLGGTLAKLHAPHSGYTFKDDMEVFSPLVDVQPLTPTLDKLWDDHEGAKKDYLPFDKKPSSLFSSPSRRSSIAEGEGNNHPIFNWKSNSTSRQDTHASLTAPGSSTTSSFKSEDTSITPPKAWGGERFSDKFTHHRQPTLSRFGMLAASGLASGSMFSGLQELWSSRSHMSGSSSSNQNLTFANLRAKDFSFNQETPLGVPENFPSISVSLPLDTKAVTRQGNLELPGSPASLTLPRRFSTYAERISTTLSSSDGTSPVGSPKIKKTGAETRAEILNGLFNSVTSAASEAGTHPMGGTSLSQKGPSQSDTQQGTSFTLQMFRSTLEETLDSFQKSIHKDMRNLHIEILRQFHIQETEISSVASSILENQAELMKEIQSLRKENQQLRQLL
ncbi:protein NEDD1-like isoform X5 [Vitis riparia]|uniref:protein NEDD1-like isoform X5 n=1 Tax=Vitis riparia TaxID=96939 RepID=UPI00155AA4C7|nr:protein NEDD1-like isoform X5 [Vitis riparia]